MSYKLEIQSNFFVVINTTTSLEVIREVRDEVKFSVNSTTYKFKWNYANGPDVANTTVTEFDFTELVDSGGLAFASQTVLNAFLSANIGHINDSISIISQVITDGVVDKVPSENAVFDALALKVNTTDLPSNLTLYPTTTASDIGGYSLLVTTLSDPDYDNPAVDVSTGSITGTGQLISSLATIAGQLTGNPGEINISTVGNIKRTAGSASAQFYYEVYHRTSGGVETLVSTSDLTTLVSSSTYIEFSASAILNNGTWLPTDRIVLKFYGSKVGAGSNPTFNFQFGGSTPVRTVMPVPASIIVDLPITIGSTSINNGTASTLLRNEGGKVGDTDYTVPKTDGTANQVLQTNGAGVVTWATISSGITIGTTPITSGTDGRVLFQAGGVIQQDSTLFWDNTNKRLGVGATPSSSVRLDIRSQGALSTDIALRVRNSADTANILTVNGVGQIWSNGKGFIASNTGFGEFSLNALTTGTNIAAFGNYALQLNTTGANNTAFGKNAGFSTTYGSNNTYLGYNAGAFDTGDGYNTLIGASAGSTIDFSVGYNTIIGASSTSGITTGGNNTLIGARITGLSNPSNNIILADGGGVQVIRKDANHNQILGVEAALVTTATNGFTYIPTCAGTPTGTPTAITGKVPIVADTTNNKLYVYLGGAWVAMN